MRKSPPPPLWVKYYFLFLIRPTLILDINTSHYVVCWHMLTFLDRETSSIINRTARYTKILQIFFTYLPTLKMTYFPFCFSSTNQQ